VPHGVGGGRRREDRGDHLPRGGLRGSPMSTQVVLPASRCPRFLPLGPGRRSREAGPHSDRPGDWGRA
jgi:hypothetical protein